MNIIKRFHPAYLTLFGVLLAATGCTYTTVQQQNGSRTGSQLAVVGRGEDRSVTAYQSTGPGSHYPPSTYPEYNGYPGSGRRYNYREGYNGYYGGPIAPAYAPDDGGIPYPLPIPCHQPFVHTELNLY